MAKAVLWETVKANAVKQANTFAFGIGYTFPAEAILDAIAERRPVWESMDELKRLIAARIMAWDIRVATRLRELFPAAFPSSIRHGALVADMNERGDWVLYGKEF